MKLSRQAATRSADNGSERGAVGTAVANPTAANHGALPKPLADSVRQIIARSQLTTERTLPTAIGVVSAISGEGVTTVSRALSQLLNHDLGAETCLIDMTWTSADRNSTTDQPEGIYEVVTGQRTIDQVVDRTGNIPTLHGGQVPASLRLRLAHSPNLEEMVTALRTRFQHLVFDLPPVLGGSDGITTLRLVDAHIMVVRYGVTTINQVQTAIDQMDGVASLGVVLNQVRTYTPRPLSRWLAS